MMGITHAALASAAVPLILSTTNPTIAGLAIIGSQLPDIDSTNSFIGQLLFPISSQLEKRYPHRSATHSFLAITVIAALWWAAIWGLNQYAGFSLGKPEWMALWLGSFVSIVSDTFTVKGCQLFFPHPVWCYSGSSWDKKRLRTGGAGELWVLFFAMVICFYLFFGGFLSEGGSLVRQLGQNLGIKSSTLEGYNEAAGSNHVYAVVKGVKSSDRSDASGKYFILDTSGQELILLDNDGNIYQTGQQLIADRLTIEVGLTASNRVETLTFNDEDAVPKLEELQKSFAEGEVFINGSLGVDFPEEIDIPLETHKLQTVKVSGSTVQFQYANIEKAITVLKDQYAIGTLELKIISPKPEF